MNSLAFLLYISKKSPHKVPFLVFSMVINREKWIGDLAFASNFAVKRTREASKPSDKGSRLGLDNLFLVEW